MSATPAATAATATATACTSPANTCCGGPRAIRLPPLVTAGSPGDLLVPGVSAGALDRPGSVVLFGNSEANADLRSGARIMAGWWFGDDRCIGIEGGGFFLGRQTDDFTATSFGSPILARPFFNVLTGRQDVEFVAEPGNAAVAGVGARTPLAGTVSVSAQNSFWGAEANLRTHLWGGCGSNVDLIGGYRYLGLDDTLTISENLQSFNTATPLAFTGLDSFKTINRFNGGQVGLKGEWHWNRWSLDGRTIIALGNVSEEVDVFGMKVANGAASGGDLLTQVGTNIGVHRREPLRLVAGSRAQPRLPGHRPHARHRRLRLPVPERRGAGRRSGEPDGQPEPAARRGGRAGSAGVHRAAVGLLAQGINFGLEFRY